MSERLVESLITDLGLTPHPEGGHYRETYRAAATLPSGRSVCTAVYYLLAAGERSTWHRLDADELWHFYRGDPLWVVELVPQAPARVTVLSASNPQHCVPAHTWFGAIPAPGSAFSLVGCTVSPGFEFAHFELGVGGELLTAFPLAADIISRLAR
jgi:uncharacterized protein